MGPPGKGQLLLCSDSVSLARSQKFRERAEACGMCPALSLREIWCYCQLHNAAHAVQNHVCVMVASLIKLGNAFGTLQRLHMLDNQLSQQSPLALVSQ